MMPRYGHAKNVFTSSMRDLVERKQKAVMLQKSIDLTKKNTKSIFHVSQEGFQLTKLRNCHMNNDKIKQ
jgi:hypothetical protein